MVDYISVGYITFENVEILNILNSIKIDTNDSYSSNDYIGGTGSHTEFISEKGRVLSFQNLCLNYEESLKNKDSRIDDYKALHKKYKNKAGAVTSLSSAKLNGNYLITKFSIEETTAGFLIDWELTEEVPFNVTKKTFNIWGTVKKASTTSKKVTRKISNISSNTKYLLKNCGYMQKNNNKGVKCVKCLQKFLKAGGYYRQYKTDGWFDIYTERELKKAQKRRKLKQTGKWDKQTRNYYRKKYNYP